MKQFEKKKSYKLPICNDKLKKIKIETVSDLKIIFNFDRY